MPQHGGLFPAFPLLFSDPASARSIGRRYLARWPGEADVLHLEASLFEGLQDSSTAGLRTRLAERRRQDFARGQTVILDGWVLAQSELRACALLTLVSRA